MQTGRFDGKALAMFSILSVSLVGCGGGHSPNGHDPEVTGSLGGAVVATGNIPQVGAGVHFFNAGGTALPNFDTTTNGVGRWQATDLPVGEYGIEFLPPESNLPGLGGLPSLHYEGVAVTEGDHTFQTVFLPPMLGSVHVRNDLMTDQVGLTFHQDPDDLGSPEPLPGLSITVRMGTQIRFDGNSVGGPGDPYEIFIALVPPEQVPMPLLDEEDRGRTNQLFFSLQPAGTTFVDSMTGDPKLVEVTYPNTNGLTPGSDVDLFRFDHDVFDWVSAGTGTVSMDGSVIVPQPGAGLPELGWNGGSGPPPPTTIVRGSILQAGQPFPHEGIFVVTNNGFFDFTDANGEFTIPDVPIIGGDTQLICLAYTDLSLAFEVANSGPVVPAFPDTVCDIDIQGSPLDDVAPSVLSIDPPDDPGGEDPSDLDVPIRIAFSEVMNPLTLDAGILIEATNLDGTSVIEGDLVAQTTDDMGTARTEAIFIPAGGSLPESSTITVSVGSEAEDLNGNGLGEPFSASFVTGMDTGGDPLVFTIEPESGSVGTAITLTGVALDGAIVTFDGIDVTADAQVTATSVVFDVPEAAGTAAPGLKAVCVGGPGGSCKDFELRPVIVSITPPIGFTAMPGDTNGGSLVTIAGFNFDPAGTNESIVFSVAGAEVDAKDESADALTIEIHVPPGASSGSVVVTSSAQSSNPFFFTVEAPIDDIPPVVLATDPAHHAIEVNCSRTVQITVNELVALDSTVEVEAGNPLAPVPGTTTIQVDSEGQGVLQFVADGPFESFATVLVAATIRDVAGNEVMEEFGFTTGAGTPLECLEQGKHDFEDGNLQAALASFQAVLEFGTATAAQQEEARFYIALLDLALAVDGEGTGPAAVALHGLLARFGFPPGGPDLFDLDTFTHPAELPEDSPTCDEVITYLSVFFIPVLEATGDQLASLSASFASVFIHDDPPEVMEIDRTDVLAIRMGLKALLFDLYWMTAYECNLDIDALANAREDLQPNADFLDADLDFLSLRPDGDLPASRLALRDAITLYGDALASLLAETDDQADDFIVFSDDPDAVMDAMKLQDDLDSLFLATNGPRVIEHGDPGQFLTVNLSATTFGTLDIRDQLPEFVDFREYSMLFDALFDGTIHGILPGFDANQVPDLLVPFDQAPVIAPGAISLDDGTTADWTSAGVTVPAATDPSFPNDWTADLPNGSGPAVDITDVFISQESSPGVLGTSDSYFFRIDLAVGTPDPSLNYYEFALESNDQTAEQPDFSGTISGSFTGEFELEVRGPFGVVIIPSSALIVQVGNGFIEFALLKQPFQSPGGVLDGAEYVFTFETFGFELGDSFEDESPPIRLSMEF